MSEYYCDPLKRLAEAINKTLAPTVKATCEGEDLIIETETNRVWFDSDFRIVGEAVTPRSEIQSGTRRRSSNHHLRPRCLPYTQAQAELLQLIWRRLH